MNDTVPLMFDGKIINVGVWVAGVGGIIAASNLVVPALRPALLPATIFVAAFAALLFMRMLLSPFYQKSVQRINLEMKGSAPWPGKFKKLSDPEWGIFGSRAGSRGLLLVRAVLFVGALPLVYAQAWIGIAVVQLWWAALFVALLSSMMHAVITSNFRKG